MRSPKFWSVSFALSLFSAVVASAGAAEAADPPEDATATWSVQPATESGPDERPSFELRLPADREVVEHIAVTNRSTVPLTLALYASDAFNTPDGGFDLLPADREPVDVGSWVSLRDSQVVVDVGESVVVPFTLVIPPDATPGDHVGGIVASMRSRAVDDKGNAVSVDNRVGTRLYVRVPGESATQLGASGVRVAYEPRSWGFQTGALEIDYLLTNTGNLRSSGTEQVSVETVFGLFDSMSPREATPELLPGQSVERSVRIEGVPAAGWVGADLVVTPGNQYVSVSDGAAVAQVRVWAAPWGPLGALLVGALLIVTLVGVRRRAGRRHLRELERAREEGRRSAEETSGGSPDGQPARVPATSSGGGVEV